MPGIDGMTNRTTQTPQLEQTPRPEQANADNLKQPEKNKKSIFQQPENPYGNIDSTQTQQPNKAIDIKGDPHRYDTASLMGATFHRETLE